MTGEGGTQYRMRVVVESLHHTGAIFLLAALLSGFVYDIISLKKD